MSLLPAPIRAVVEASYGEAIADLFLIAVPLGLIALIAVIRLREVPLGTRSGMAQRLAEQVAEAVAADDASLAPAGATVGSRR